MIAVWAPLVPYAQSHEWWVSRAPARLFPDGRVPMERTLTLRETASGELGYPR